jgi:hypothetical protein
MENLVGVPLDKFMRAAFFIMVGARVNAGWFDPAWMRMPHITQALDVLEISSTQVMDVFSRFFAIDFATFQQRVAEERQRDSRLQRYEFNPLVDKPSF